MSTEIARLHASIGADLSGLEKGLKAADAGLAGLDSKMQGLGGAVTAASKAADGFDDAGKKAAGFSDKMATAGGTITRTGGLMSVGLTAPLLLMGNAAKSAASDTEESLNKARVVFGEASADVEAFANTSATSLGLAKQATLEAVATFGNLTQSSGIAKGASADMSLGLVQLASDLGSFNNQSPEEMLIKLRAGLVGEVEPLRSVGINLNAATTEAKALAMGLAATSDELTEADKMQARYALVLEQSTLAQGDFARTADGLANSQRIQKAEAKDLEAEMGKNLLPTMKEITKITTDALKAFNGLSPEMKTAVVAGGALLAVIGPLTTAVGAAATITGVLTAATTSHRAATIAHTAATAAMTAGQWLLNAALTANPIGLVVVALAGLTAAIVYAYQNSETFRNIVDGAWKAVSTATSTMTKAVGDAFGAMGTKIGEVWDGAKTAAKTAINAILGAVNSMISAWNALEFKIPGFSIELPSAEIAGQKIGGGTLGWEGITIGTPDIPPIPILDQGGIVSKPTLALLAANGIPEAVTPLPRMPDLAPTPRLVPAGGGMASGWQRSEPRQLVVNVYGNTLLADDYATARQLADILEPMITRFAGERLSR